ncbi:ankyrin repeat domain-containing protein [Brevundimonas sp. 2R-24]|uniref:Ankyrin repeat domain-containing protein n=1 Tax=Peiella sedimenti TaxID=3061083 RepID=A0ABT8SLW7_9CAUL|nr:ankyrin repeat domain-containing protein [Caulobacteraceae bacterium XZ-24]
MTTDPRLERVRNGRTDLVLEMLAEGLPPEERADDGVPLIRWCAYYGDVSAIRALLATGAPLSSLGENLDLMGAAFHGHWRLCEFLIEQGADPDWVDPTTGETALHAALSRVNPPHQSRVVAVLLAAGAQVQARTLRDAETGAFMRDVRTRGETPLHRAAAFADAETIERLLEAGADRTARDAAGDSPLSWASWHLRPAHILKLLCFGEHRINPTADWRGDHGAGTSGMALHLCGKPAGFDKAD